MPQLSDANNDAMIKDPSKGLDLDFFANLPLPADTGSDKAASNSGGQQLAGFSTDDVIKVGTSIVAGVAGAWLIKRFWNN